MKRTKRERWKMGDSIEEKKEKDREAHDGGYI
jgi:hypothetical protein